MRIISRREPFRAAIRTGLAVAALCLPLLGGQVWSAPTALAYQGCQTSGTATANPGSANGGQSVTVTATFTDCNGQGGQGVIQFSQQSGPANCRLVFTPPSAPANANGSATTTVTLPPGCPCQYVVAATQNGVTATTTIRENGCLPFTSTARPAHTVPAQPITPFLGGAAALAAAGGFLLLLQRRVASRGVSA